MSGGLSYGSSSGGLVINGVTLSSCDTSKWWFDQLGNGGASEYSLVRVCISDWWNCGDGSDTGSIY